MRSLVHALQAAWALYALQCATAGGITEGEEVARRTWAAPLPRTGSGASKMVSSTEYSAAMKEFVFNLNGESLIALEAALQKKLAALQKKADYNPTSLPVGYNPTRPPVDYNPMGNSMDYNPTLPSPYYNPTRPPVDYNQAMPPVDYNPTLPPSYDIDTGAEDRRTWAARAPSPQEISAVSSGWLRGSKQDSQRSAMEKFVLNLDEESLVALEAALQKKLSTDIGAWSYGFDTGAEDRLDQATVDVEKSKWRR